jgi:hypothetical protein
MHWMSVKLPDNFQIREHSWPCLFHINYTLYKNPGFWLVNSRCIFRVFSYLGLIRSFLPLPGYLHEDLTFLPSRASNRQIHSEYFFFTFIRSDVNNQIWNPEVFRSKEFNFFSRCRGICENVFNFFTLTCRKPPNSFGILQPLSNKTNRNTTTVPAEGNSSKRPIVFNNCQVTNNKKRIFLKTTNKRYYLFSQYSK